jgi:hypothetical protein
MFQTQVVEKIKTHFMFHNLFFRHSCRLRNNVEKFGSARRATRDAEKTQFVCQATKARMQTLVIFNTYVFSTATMVKRTRLSFALYVRCLSCYSSSVPPDSRCFPRTYIQRAVTTVSIPYCLFPNSLLSSFLLLLYRQSKFCSVALLHFDTSQNFVSLFQRSFK